MSDRKIACSNSTPTKCYGELLKVSKPWLNSQSISYYVCTDCGRHVGDIESNSEKEQNEAKL